MKTDFVKALETLLEDPLYRSPSVHSHIGVPLSFLAASMGIIPKDLLHFDESFNGQSLGYYIAVSQVPFSKPLGPEDFPTVEWTQEQWLYFLRMNDSCSGRTVAHVFSEYGLLRPEDLLIVGNDPCVPSRTIAQDWCFNRHPLPKNFFAEARKQRWSTDILYHLAKHAIDGDSLPDSFDDWGLSRRNGWMNLAAEWLDSACQRRFLHGYKPAVSVPWDDKTWMLEFGDRGERQTVAHYAAGYDALPLDFPKKFLKKKNEKGVTVLEIQEEAQEISKLMKKARSR